MKVLLLSIKPSPLRPIIEKDNNSVIELSDPIDLEFVKQSRIDFAVSYRYRHIIRRPIIEYLKGNIINLHISLLPWNRGADPNLWSFLDNTPKGITIHYIDDGIDTGDIIVQKELFFDEDIETLATSYKALNHQIIELFNKQWLSIISGKTPRYRQPQSGTYHQARDKKPFEGLLNDLSWNTPVKQLISKAILPKR
jgi:methionyl-tRNA formyltransferase